MSRLLFAVCLSLIPAAASAQGVDFVRQVRPIFEARCYSCHGPEKQKNGLRLDRRKDALAGGDSGAVIVPGKSGASELLKRVASRDKSERMPPTGEALSADQIQTIQLWIDQGAAWPDDGAKPADRRDWWSFQPIVKPPVPLRTPHSALRTAGNPIDAFVRAKLREKGLAPSPEADRRTLIRRVCFDLTGLPPTPDEVDDFVRDADPLAYAKLIDRLLASPRYGERWARHWLDVVHYGDTHGYDKDKPRPNAWPYRDYVIRAFNSDKPYGRFVQEQLAGDVLFPDSPDGVPATGFLAAGPWDFIGHAEVSETKIDGKIARLLDRDDMVSNAFNTFVSLTVQCARCHNHKFDPVTQTDYYRMQAVFAALDRADRSFDADPNIARQRVAVETRRHDLAAQKKLLDEQAARLAGPELAELERRITAASQAGASPSAELKQKRSELLARTLSAEIRAALADNDRALAQLELAYAKLPPAQLVYAGVVYNGSGAFTGTGASGGKPRPIHVLARGDVRTPGTEVGPGTVPLRAGEDGAFRLPPGHTEGQRRAELARWMTDPLNPLTWRSIVNRVWQYHFGRGLVDSPNDFGHMGQPPSHPELLDWLAAEFRDHDQSLKSLHRLIVTSATYRQASGADRVAQIEVAPSSIDAGNVFLWRMNRRKLEAEAVRDTVLAIAGQLSPQMGGPAFQDFVVEKPEHSPHYQYHLHDPEDPATHRRSVYRFLVRSQPQPFMTTLDCADPSMSVDKRNETLTALQALALLNNRFMLTMAGHLAQRVHGDVAQAFRLALSRDPTAAERTALTEYAARHGAANACRVILNLNEFAFVD